FGAGSALADVGGDFEENTPYVLSIIDDPDPTGRSRSSRPRLLHSTPAIELDHRRGDERPSLLAFPADDRPIVAWARKGRDGFDVVISSRVGGRWSEPVVLAGSPADELDPRLAVDPRDGTVHVVFWVRDATPAVIHRQAPADLAQWSEPRFVSPPGEAAMRPSPSIDDGRLRIVYEAHAAAEGSTPHLIVLATDGPGGFTTEVVGLSLHDGANLATIDGTGWRLRVRWDESLFEGIEAERLDDGRWLERRLDLPSGAPRRSRPWDSLVGVGRR
ncbi:MAG TPA: hypothetical protein VD788_07000, partial [Candidatus Polarisedimenticolaceae bacterium]|nr:hypothetical protein [Candidatus Polarisedimenticolaceae bacterium]